MTGRSRRSTASLDHPLAHPSATVAVVAAHAADTVAGEAARNVPGHARNVPGHGLRRVDSSQGRARPSTPPAPMNGPSMGAMTVVYLAAQYPDHFAA